MLERRSLLTALGVLAVARPALAQTTDQPTPPPPMPAPGAPGAASPDRPRVVLLTSKGAITLELRADKAPITAANFLRYVDTKRFDGAATFYRAARAPSAPTVGFIEGGLQNDRKRLLPPIAHESTTQTGLQHIDGAISMARYAPGTATADFFICSGPAPGLDANPQGTGDNQGFAVFGGVVDGMDVVRAILASPTPGVARNPVMAGQIIEPPVPILTARRV
jgi:peptidyl-prolyl cis-trans isomerase A (cyclophilin A)